MFVYIKFSKILGPGAKISICLQTLVCLFTFSVCLFTFSMFIYILGLFIYISNVYLPKFLNIFKTYL